MNWPIDIVLGLALLGYLVSGLRRGFVRSIGGLIGVIAGGVAAFYVVPLVGGLVPDQLWRLLASIGVAIALVAVGGTIGSAIGRAIARNFDDTPLRFIDRVLGGAVNLVVTALVISLLAASVAPLGIPLLSQSVSDSVVISAIDSLTPTPVQQFLARIRSTAVKDTIPNIVEAFGGVTASPGVPNVDTSTDALTAAATSVVRITGNAYACGQSQSGTGFVVAKNRIMTNAHVVAGVSQPVVQIPGGGALAGRIVYFDPIDDLAIIAVSGLDAPTLALSAPLTKGDDAVYDGYPFGGPFTTGPAQVLAVGSENVEDIYNTSTSPREVYTLAADIQPGDSGGPLLTQSGKVAGVVFAKSAKTAQLGYAMTVAELSPVATEATSLTARVASGHCSQG
ncbi:MarP family serine protease [soil metagenome]